MNDLNDSKVKFIKDLIRGDRKLNLDTVSNYNGALSPLFSIILILIKSYENGKLLAKLEEEQFPSET